MATIILGAVGRAVGGPIGGIVGTLAGGFVDRAMFGGGARDGGRMANPMVQSSAYGEPIAFVFGRMRVAGNVIWSSGIAERVGAFGGGKGGAAASPYSYSASVAVGLSARTVAGIGRVWADGRLIRDADGVWLLPVTMRLHAGSARQAADPLIAAAEGAGGAPAYRGLAYVVFEDLPLADFGNRIPSFSFELIADAEEGLDFGQAMVALARGSSARLEAFDVRGDFPALTGFVAARPGSLGSNLAPLIEAVHGAVVVEADGLAVLRLTGDAAPVVALDAVRDGQAVAGVGRGPGDRQRLAGDNGADCVELGHYATDRDFQAGLQRVRRAAGQRVEQLVLPVAMAAGVAKALAADLLVRRGAMRLTRLVRLPWRHLAVVPGVVVRLSDSDALWRVREQRFEGFVLSVALERIGVGAASAGAGDGGRAQVFADAAAGPTTLMVVELPGLGGTQAVQPDVRFVAAGAAAGWRRAAIQASRDEGLSYAAAGVVTAPGVMGVVVGGLAAGPVAAWDGFTTLEVELLSDAMWLEGLPAAAVLQGGNLAMVGDELLQFADAEALGPRRFRLRTLLRGRRGTEWAVAGHAAGEPFVMVGAGAGLALDVGVDAIGRSLAVRAMGAGDDGTVVRDLTVTGRALQPLAPAHLVLSQVGGDVHARWTRRSRAGFSWLDFADAPLAEEREAYEVVVRSASEERRRVRTTAAALVYAAAERMADGGGAALEFEVAQISAVVGPGRRARAAITVV